jgi:hypothetical protein
MSILNKIQQLPEYKGIKLNEYFYIPAVYFGKKCDLLYKVIGFDPDNDIIYANKRNKKTMLVNNKSAICEGFKFEFVNDILKSNLLHNKTV